MAILETVLRPLLQKAALPGAPQSIREKAHFFLNNKLFLFHPWGDTSHRRPLSGAVTLPPVGQWRFITTPRPNKMFVAANKVGKTWLLVAEAISHAIGRRLYLTEDDPCYWVKNAIGERIKVPNEGRVVCVDEDHGIKEEMIPMFRELTPAHLVPRGFDNHVSRDQSLLELFIDGNPSKVSRISFMTYNQMPQAHSGKTIHWLYLNEPPPEEIFAENVRGLIHTHGPWAMFFTPVIAEDWLFMKTESPGDDVEIIRADMEDCPFMTRDKIEMAMREFPEEEHAARIHGQFMQLEGRIYKNFHRDLCVIRPIKLDPLWPAFAAIDDHDSAPTACLAVVVDPYGRRFYVEEYYKRGLIKEHAELRDMLLRWKVRAPFPLIDPHSVRQRQRSAEGGKKIEQLWREILDMPVTPAKSGRVTLSERDKDSNRRLRWQKLNDVFALQERRGFVNGREEWIREPGGYVFNTCKNFISQLVGRQYRSLAGDAAPDKTKAAEDHLTDCAEYMEEWGISFDYYDLWRGSASPFEANTQYSYAQ